MATPHGGSISGRLFSRVVGCIELLLALLLIGGYGWYLNINWPKYRWCSNCVLEAILFGIYSVFGLVISVLLIISTFTILGLNSRKWIAVIWCTFDMVSFIGSVVLMCVHEDFENNAQHFLVMVAYLIKWAAFFCVVCTYVWGISEKIQDNQVNRMPSSPMRNMESRREGGRAGGMWLLHGGKKEVGKLKISTKL